MERGTGHAKEESTLAMAVELETVLDGPELEEV